MKYLSLFLTTCLVFFCAAKNVFAQVVINEFVPNASIEWVELFNSSSSAEYLKSYYLDDDTDFQNDSGSGPKKSLSFININNPTFPVFETSGLLNNSGDYVVIFSGDGTIIDQYQYSSDPGSEISIGRIPNGTGNFSILSSTTKGVSNPEPTLTPSPTVSVTPSPTNSPSPTITRSTYKINSVKGSDGATLSNIKIYVDGFYTHHYAPEAIIFCPGCHCDDSDTIDCEFGIHTIKLAKENYSDWSEQKTLNSADNFEVNPIMSKIIIESTQTPTPTSTPSPTSTITLSPTITPKTSPVPLVTASASSSIGATLSAEIFSPSPEEGILGTSSSKTRGNNPNIYLIFGGLTIAGSGSWLYFRHRKD